MKKVFRPELIKNKLFATAFILIGLPVVLLDNDATVLVFALMIGVPMFFSKTSYIV